MNLICKIDELKVGCIAYFPRKWKFLTKKAKNTKQVKKYTELTFTIVRKQSYFFTISTFS